MTARAPTPAWFETLLLAARARAGSRAALGRGLGVPPQTIMAWETGSEPGIHYLQAILTYLGVDIARVFPDVTGLVREDPTGYGHSVEAEPTLPLIGRVAAGSATFHAAEVRAMPGSASLWRNSARWHLVQPRTLAYIRVQGDSMTPTYPDGVILACGRPAGNELPDLTPVIVRIGDDEHTFKLLLRSTSEVLLLPINQQHQVQRYAKSRVQVEYVVLGHTNLGR